jgi:VWFA-related protein
MTRDHDVIVRAIAQFTGRKFDYTPRNDIEQQYATYPAETVELIRNQVSLSALRGLIVHMGTLKEGRKALIVVSEGFSNTLPPQLRDPVAIAPGFANPDRGNPMAGVGDPNEQTAQFFANTTLDGYLREVYDTANRNNVALYPVDPRGLPTSEFDISQPAMSMQVDSQYLNQTMNTLRVLAEQTDGRAIVNRNDLGVGMRQIVRDTSAYYLLGYNSTRAPADGKFHEIKVQVKRPGVQVRARKGYWALTASDVARALAPPKADPPKAVDHALASINQAAASHLSILTWIGTSRGANGKTKVTFVWEPAPVVAGDRSGAELPVRVMLTAIGADGGPSFRGRVPEAAPATTPAAVPGTTRGPARIAFEVAPGPLRLRMSVEGAAAQVIDTDAREIAVPDLTSAHTVFGTPEVLRARTARDFQQMKSDPDAVPVAARAFSRTEHLLIRVPVYGPGETAPVLTVHLLNRSGQAMSELSAVPSSTAGAQLIDVPLAGLAAGEYLVEIKAGDGEASDLVGFRVTG